MARVNLDDKGRCCGRKPLLYKRNGQLFCPRCDRAFALDDGTQIENWAWRKNGEKWELRIFKSIWKRAVAIK
jgi:uncharacterized Zn finger protein (UPF0148 family)